MRQGNRIEGTEESLQECPVPLGPQVITWRLGGPKGMDGNGDTMHAANAPILQPP